MTNAYLFWVKAYNWNKNWNQIFEESIFYDSFEKYNKSKNWLFKAGRLTFSSFL